MANEGEHSRANISLSDLIFTVSMDIGTSRTGVITHGKNLNDLASNDQFRIQADNLSHWGRSKFVLDDVRIRWEVRYTKDSENFVTIFDTRKSLDTNVGLFTVDLLDPNGLLRSGLVADVNVGFNGELLDTISLEIYNEHDRKYYSVDDTLKYLQRFFL